MIDILLTVLVLAFAAGAGAHIARSIRSRRGQKFLVRFKDGGVGVYGPNVHRRLVAAGLVEKSERI